MLINKNTQFPANNNYMPALQKVFLSHSLIESSIFYMENICKWAENKFLKLEYYNLQSE